MKQTSSGHCINCRFTSMLASFFELAEKLIATKRPCSKYEKNIPRPDVHFLYCRSKEALHITSLCVCAKTKARTRLSVLRLIIQMI